VAAPGLPCLPANGAAEDLLLDQASHLLGVVGLSDGCRAASAGGMPCSGRLSQKEDVETTVLGASVLYVARRAV